MTYLELVRILERLAMATRNKPTAGQIEVMIECITDNRLTDDQIMRAYRTTRDLPDPFWPMPGEFLARASSAPEVGSREHRRALIEHLLSTLEPHSHGWVSTKAVLDRMNLPARVN